MKELLQKLKDPFPADYIKWRVGATTKDKTKGIALAYIDSRAVQDRLDDIIGAENWQDEYQFGKTGEIICKIGIKIENEWVWKSDGAGQTDFEAEKGGLSDAFKRAAVKWGIGRYLYGLDANWVPIKQQGKSYVIVNPPRLPGWALPKGEEPVVLINDKVLATIKDYIGQDEKATNLIKSDLKDKGYHDWNGLYQYTEKEGEELLKKIKNIEKVGA